MTVLINDNETGDKYYIDKVESVINISNNMIISYDSNKTKILNNSRYSYCVTDEEEIKTNGIQ